jgi:DNA excision repair protein ERCC-8
MNQLLLSRRLGNADPQAFQRAQYERLVHSITPEQSVKFDSQPVQGDSSLERLLGSSSSHGKPLATAGIAAENALAHNGGVNIIAVDHQTGRYLISGGADSAIRLWDLEEREASEFCTYHPAASNTRSTPGSHTHALTSLSVYPFDPVPSTIITTSYDKTLKLFAIEAARIAPVHTFDVVDTPYTHSLSPIVSSAALIAVGTAHPAVKLLDLRTGLSTHTLPGHDGAVFSVRWSPRSEHVLASGSTDGRVLFFDVRRAHSAFACLDYDDALGVLSSDSTSSYQPRPALDWSAKAHNGPVTGVRWADNGEQLITCGHDQRIRVWDAATGSNELVHFGPRIKNHRNGEFNPLTSPGECGRPGKGTLFWANDEGKGEIFVMDMKEGTMLTVLRTPGTARSTQKTASVGKLTSGGRINSTAWRIKAESGSGLELYSGHGDGSIHCWTGMPPEDQEIEDKVDAEAEVEQMRKRKRNLLDGIVEGLTKKPMTSI